MAVCFLWFFKKKRPLFDSLTKRKRWTNKTKKKKTNENIGRKGISAIFRQAMTNEPPTLSSGASLRYPADSRNPYAHDFVYYRIFFIAALTF